MTLTKLVLRRPVSAALIILGIVIFGIASIFGFKMELIPDIQMPMMIVATVYPGANPESVETLISDEVESSAMVLSGVKNCLSYSYENYSMVALTYDYEQDMNDAYTDLRASLDALKLPDDAQDPIIMQLDVNAMATESISVTNDGSADMMAYIDDVLVPELESVSNVAKVEVTGGRENYVRVQLNESKMKEYGLSITSIAQFVGAADYNIPAGSISGGSQDIGVSARNEFLTLQDLKDTTLMTGTDSLITLGDVADISFATKDPSSLSRYNGEENVMVSVTKNQRASAVTVCKDVNAIIEAQEANDPGVTFGVIYDSGHEIVKSLTQVGETLLLGVLLAMIVLFVFFGDFKASLIVGSSMPVSVLATLVAMYLMGFNLNIVTTGAMVIAIGMIVDNSIVVIESCFRLKDECEDYTEAAIKGTNVVWMSILASTITTVVVYLPLSIMNGMAGQMFGQLGFIVVFAMLASLISALCIVPLLFSKTKPIEKKELPINRLLSKVYARYDKLLRKLLYKKKTTIAVSLVLLLITGAIAMTLDFELVPTSYDGSISIAATFRSGTKLEKMDEELAEIEAMVADDENFDRYSISIGGGLQGGSNTATIQAYAVDDCKRSSQDAVTEYVSALSGITGMDLDIQATGGDSSAMSGMTSDRVNIVLEGKNLDDLANATEMVQEVMMQTEGVIATTSDVSASKTTAHVVIDPLKAGSAGFTPAQIAADLYMTLSGTTAANMEVDGKEYDIMLEYPKGAYENENQLLNKTFTSPMGKNVMLSDIAHISYDEELQVIQKNNGKYQLNVYATVGDAKTLNVKRELNAAIKELDFPEGVATATSMVTDIMNENLYGIFLAILASIFLVFLVMAMQFESSRFSLMVMVCIPFSLIGSFLLLAVFGNSINMVSMMGFLMLMGIVVNNGILLVDTVNQEKERLGLTDALVTAGQIRLRPILMTTLTTILAMIPMLIFSDNKMMEGMSLVIIGGLFASTLLCLLMMPTFYLLIAKKED